MRVLLALDGSLAADAAREAVRSLHLPTGTLVSVIGVVGPTSDAMAPRRSSGPGTPSDPGAWLERVVDEAVMSLQAPDRAVDGTIAIGRPASVIVDVATERRSDLIVVGSRGRGPLAAMLLGSVSAEVVDHAPCAVMVVRSSLDGPVLIAVDGSSSAEAAVTYVVANRFLDGHELQVLSVAHTAGVAAAWEAGALSPLALESVGEQRLADRRELELVTARAAMRLRAAGYVATSSIVDGHAPERIIETAAALGCRLIVMGSRGMTGLKRILVGSVARATLLHARASVLIVREPIREERPEAAELGRVRGAIGVSPA